ncbi:MAG: hypothetical protein LUC23_02875 [Prevotellaceae bacterium]|nr:hypothetical protein [Prevotellaceae bacterium]
MRKWVYILLSVCLLTACKDSDGVAESGASTVKDAITLTSDAVTVGQEGGSVSIAFTTNKSWSAVVGNSAASWCGIEVTSGSEGSNVLVATVAENESYDERNASITIYSGTAKAYVTVTQKQKDALIVESDKVELGAAACVFTITAAANVSLTCAIADDAKSWISAETDGQTRALASVNFSFTAGANTDAEARQGDIVFTGGNGLTETVTVYQQGEEEVLVLTTAGNLVVGDGGGTVKVELQSNVAYEMVLPQVDWITETETRAVSSYTHYLDVTPNEGGEARQADVIFRSTDKSLADTVTVVQVQKGAVVVAASTYRVSGKGAVLCFDYNTAVDFRTEISVDWITVCEDDGTGTYDESKFSVKVEKNPAVRERTGTVTLSYGDVVQTITVVQGVGSYTLRVELVHAETEFAALSFQGDDIMGTVDWGDGSSSGDIDEAHVFSDADEKTTVYEMYGVDVFRIEALNSVSSIVIYCADGE